MNIILLEKTRIEETNMYFFKLLFFNFFIFNAYSSITLQPKIGGSLLEFDHDYTSSSVLSSKGKSYGFGGELTWNFGGKYYTGLEVMFSTLNSSEGEYQSSSVGALKDHEMSLTEYTLIYGWKFGEVFNLFFGYIIDGEAEYKDNIVAELGTTFVYSGSLFSYQRGFKVGVEYKLMNLINITAEYKQGYYTSYVVKNSSGGTVYYSPGKNMGDVKIKGLFLKLGFPIEILP